jgi:hypothetical protein
LRDNQKDNIIAGIHEFENITKVTLTDYFYILTGLFNWFINIPLKRRQYPDESNFKYLGFNPSGA